MIRPLEESRSKRRRSSASDRAASRGEQPGQATSWIVGFRPHTASSSLAERGHVAFHSAKEPMRRGSPCRTQPPRDRPRSALGPSRTASAHPDRDSGLPAPGSAITIQWPRPSSRRPGSGSCTYYDRHRQPVMKTATSGMIFFLLPITPNCRVTTNSFLAGSSKSMKTNRLAFLAVAQVLVERDALGDDDVDALAGLDQAGRLDHGHGPHGLGQVVVDSQRFRRLRAGRQPLAEHDLLNDSRSASRTSGGT